MAIAVRIPGTLREYCGITDEVQVVAATVAEALDALRLQYPEVHGCVCDETGAVRRHINLFVNAELVSKGESRGTQLCLNTGDVLTIWTAVSGG